MYFVLMFGELMWHSVTNSVRWTILSASVCTMQVVCDAECLLYFFNVSRFDWAHQDSLSLRVVGLALLDSTSCLSELRLRLNQIKPDYITPFSQ